MSYLVGEGDAVLNLYLLVLALEFCSHLDLVYKTNTLKQCPHDNPLMNVQ